MLNQPKPFRQSSYRCDVSSDPLAYLLIQSVLCAPRCVFWSWDPQAWQQDKTRRLIHPSLTPLWETQLLAMQIRPQDSWLNPQSIRPLSTTAVGIAWRDPAEARSQTEEERHEPVSKEHAIILDIKHLAGDPVRVTQWAKEKSLHHK